MKLIPEPGNALNHETPAQFNRNKSSFVYLSHIYIIYLTL